MSQNGQVKKTVEPEKKSQDFREKLKFYVTFSAAVIGICSFSLFLFLIPFIVDPALSTLNHDFIQEPVQCTVLLNKYILGASKCGWSSCREGCTTDLYECNHVYVEYRPLSEDREIISTNTSSHLPPPTSSSNQVAVLFVNIRACGYPPTTVCQNWYNTSGVNGSTIDCFYSRTNSSLAITDLDPATNTRDLLLAFITPILICTLSGAVIILLHRGETRETERRLSYLSKRNYEIETESAATENPIKDSSQRRPGKKNEESLAWLRLSSSDRTKRKAEVFDIPTFAKKIKTAHVYSDSSSFDNLMSTSSSCQSQYPPSPVIN